MEIYLVGGAVRDQLLGVDYHDSDYVVVGSTPDALLAQGFQQVGSDFPVFLHPETKEEYALARTERKSGSGYNGFSCYSEPDVTLEQDLLRRDLTINAIAKSENGELVDPYGGQQDIENKILRHVSDAFVEDPLRVLRVARFAARYYPLGFRVADETLELMRALAESGELEALTPERVWKETERALTESLKQYDSSAHIYFDVLRQCGALKVIFPELDALFGVPQPEKHHPEIDTGIHTLMCLQQACKLSNEISVRFATLVHDLGKGLTKPEDWPRHIDHEKRGLTLVEQCCRRMRVPKHVEQVALLVTQYHTHVHRAFELKPQTIMKLLKSCDAIRRPDRFEHILLACKADSRGRTGFEDVAYLQVDYLRECAKAAQAITPNDLPDLPSGEKPQGAELGKALERSKVTAIAKIKTQWQSRTAG